MPHELIDPIDSNFDKPDVPDNDFLFITLTNLLEECAAQHPECPCEHGEQCLILQDAIAEKSSMHLLMLGVAATFRAEIRRFMTKENREVKDS